LTISHRGDQAIVLSAVPLFSPALIRQGNVLSEWTEKGWRTIRDSTVAKAQQDPSRFSRVQELSQTKNTM
jgi:hypothetical protein